MLVALSEWDGNQKSVSTFNIEHKMEKWLDILTTNIDMSMRRFFFAEINRDHRNILTWYLVQTINLYLDWTCPTTMKKKVDSLKSSVFWISLSYDSIHINFITINKDCLLPIQISMSSFNTSTLPISESKPSTKHQHSTWKTTLLLRPSYHQNWILISLQTINVRVRGKEWERMWRQPTGSEKRRVELSPHDEWIRFLEHFFLSCCLDPVLHRAASLQQAHREHRKKLSKKILFISKTHRLATFLSTNSNHLLLANVDDELWRGRKKKWEKEKRKEEGKRFFTRRRRRIHWVWEESSQQLTKHKGKLIVFLDISAKKKPLLLSFIKIFVFLLLSLSPYWWLQFFILWFI